MAGIRKKARNVEPVMRALAREVARYGIRANCVSPGIINTSPFFETTVAQFRQLFDINVIGSFLSVREGAKYMQSGARVCMVASISSYTGGGYVARGAYATSKGAVLTMMKSCARELGPRGIAVNAVAPGLVHTPWTQDWGTMHDFVTKASPPKPAERAFASVQPARTVYCAVQSKGGCAPF